MIDTKPISWNIDGGLVAPEHQGIWAGPGFATIPFWEGGGNPRMYPHPIVSSGVGAGFSWDYTPFGVGLTVDLSNSDTSEVTWTGSNALWADLINAFTIECWIVFRGSLNSIADYANCLSGNDGWRLFGPNASPQEVNFSVGFGGSGTGVNEIDYSDVTATDGDVIQLVGRWEKSGDGQRVIVYNWTRHLEVRSTGTNNTLTHSASSAALTALGETRAGGDRKYTLLQTYIHPTALTDGEIIRRRMDPFGPLRMARPHFAKVAAAPGARPQGPLGHPFHGPFAGPIAA